MKSIILSIALLSAPVVIAESHLEMTEIQETMTEKVSFDATSAQEAQEMDEFDILMDSDVRLDDIEEPKPVSPCEAYLKGIGVHLLMKYIALRTWMGEQWTAWAPCNA